MLGYTCLVVSVLTGCFQLSFPLTVPTASSRWSCGKPNRVPVQIRGLIPHCVLTKTYILLQFGLNTSNLRVSESLSSLCEKLPCSHLTHSLADPVSSYLMVRKHGSKSISISLGVALGRVPECEGRWFALPSTCLYSRRRLISLLLHFYCPSIPSSLLF